MKSKFFPAALSAIALLAIVPIVNAATHTWTGASGDGKWSTAFNWSGGAPTAAEAAPVVLSFPAAGSKFTTNDIANLTLDQIQVSGDNYWITGTGSGTNLTLRSQVLSQTFFLTGANAIFTNFLFNLSTNYVSNGSIAVSTGDTAIFRSRFTGNGGLIKYGNGTARLQGGLPNTYAGETLVYGGTLELNHSSNAIPSTLIIGNPSLSTTGTVTLLFQNQIADTANVRVYQNGEFDPGVFGEAITSLTISNVAQVGGPSLISSNGITSFGQSSLSGIFQLAGAQRTFNVIDGQLTITGFIENNVGTAGIKKIGAGVLQLNQDNGYNGTTLINDGKLIVANAGALGTSAFQTQVNTGGKLEVAAGISVTTEPLTLNGNSYDGAGALIMRPNSVWNGDIDLQTDTSINLQESNGFATLNSTIGGAGGLRKLGPGTLRLAGSSANTFTGETHVSDGNLELGKPAGVNAIASTLHIGADVAGPAAYTKVVLTNANQIADSSPIIVDATGELSLNGFSERVGPLTMRRGTITTGAGTLTLGSDVLVADQTQFQFPNTSEITGNISLGGVTRTIGSADQAYLHVYGGISDGGASAGIIIDFLVGGLYLHDGPNTYTGPTDVHSGFLELYSNATPGSAAGGTMVGSNASLALRGTTVGNELLTLSSDMNVWADALYFGGTNTWSGPINLNSNTVVLSYDGPTSRLILGGAITGPGSLTKLYQGTIVLAGVDDNTFTGGLTVNDGVVELNKTSGATAVPCPLTIGNATNAAGSALVVLKAANQIANNASVFIDKSGKLDIGTFNDTIGALTLRGGTAAGSSGLLTLNGNMSAKEFPNNYALSTISCRLSLGGSTRTFDTEPKAYVSLMSDVLDGGGSAGVQKTGFGSVYLYAPTTYSGETVVNEGYLVLSGTGTPGNTTAGTTVYPNGTLELVDSIITSESLTLYGNTNSFYPSIYSYANSTSSNYWGGPITVYGEPRISGYTGRTINLGGPISGPGGLNIGSDGDVYLTGSQPNTYAGKTTVSYTSVVLNKTVGNAIPGELEISGYVKLLRPDQINDTASVIIGYYGLLALNNNSETIGSLGRASEDYYSSGNLNLGSGILTLGGNNSTTEFGGSIDGSGGLVKEGTGTFTLNGYSTYTGDTTIKNGRVNVDATQPSSNVKLMGGVLGGRGKVGSITGGGAYVAPGHSLSNERFGRLQSSGISLDSSSQMRIDLGGTVAGTDHDQLTVTNGLFILNNCALLVNPMSSGAVSNQYMIIRSDAGVAMGTFSGLPEGATFNANGIQFKISYVGGDGNDVVLTQLSAPAPSQIGGISKLPNGQMQINGTGNAGLNYRIEANSDLSTTNWVNLGTVQADNQGVINFTDTDAANFQQRFYRFKSL